MSASAIYQNLSASEKSCSVNLAVQEQEFDPAAQEIWSGKKAAGMQTSTADWVCPFLL